MSRYSLRNDFEANPSSRIPEPYCINIDIPQPSRSPAARMLPLSKPAARQPRKWTAAEDQKLREEVEAQSTSDRHDIDYSICMGNGLTPLPGSGGEVKDWCRIAAKLPGRTNKDCRKRWLNSVAGGLKKGQWAKNEDQQLARGVERFGQRWTVSTPPVTKPYLSKFY